MFVISRCHNWLVSDTPTTITHLLTWTEHRMIYELKDTWPTIVLRFNWLSRRFKTKIIYTKSIYYGQYYYKHWNVKKKNHTSIKNHSHTSHSSLFDLFSLLWANKTALINKIQAAIDVKRLAEDVQTKMTSHTSKQVNHVFMYVLLALFDIDKQTYRQVLLCKDSTILCRLIISFLYEHMTLLRNISHKKNVVEKMEQKDGPPHQEWIIQ